MLTAVIAALLVLRCSRRRGPDACRLIGRWARYLLWIGGVQLSVSGELPRAPALIVSNHRSYLDILVLLRLLPTTFLCKKEVRAWPIIGAVAQRMGVVFVDRRNASSRARTISDIAALVARGRLVTAFPEGTTYEGPGMGPTRPGLFRASSQSGFALVPMVIEYGDVRDAWVGDDTLVRHILFWLSKPRTVVAVLFGSPLLVSDADALQRRSDHWMREQLASARDQLAMSLRLTGSSGEKGRQSCGDD